MIDLFRKRARNGSDTPPADEPAKPVDAAEETARSAEASGEAARSPDTADARTDGAQTTAPWWAAPEDAPFHLVAAWHDRLMIAAPGDHVAALAGHPFIPTGRGLTDVNRLADATLPSPKPPWNTYHDDGFAELGVDLAPDWQLSGDHTGFMKLFVAARGRLDPVDLTFTDPDLGERIAIDTPDVRWAGLFGAHRAVVDVRLEFFDPGDRYVGEASTRVPPERLGGRHPDGYASLGETVAVPPGATAVRFKIRLTPLADADDAYVFFSLLELSGSAPGERRPVARPLSSLGPVMEGLSEGRLILSEAPLAPLVAGAPPVAVNIDTGGTAYTVGERVSRDGTARAAITDGGVTVETGRATGRVRLLLDGAPVGSVVAAPGVGLDTHRLPTPIGLNDGLVHRLELVDASGRIAIGFASAPRHTTPWSRILDDVMPPIPGTGAPLAEHRYRALLTHARLAAEGKQSPWLRENLARLHDALVAGPQRAVPFALSFQAVEVPHVSIIIPVHNGYPTTFIALASLAFAPVETTFEIIVVDDGSTDDTKHRLGEHQGLTVLRNDTPIGFLKAVNRGAEAAHGRHLLILNNDTEVTEGWLDGLREAFRLFPEAGIVGPKIVFPDGRLQDAGGLVDHRGEPTMVGRGGNAHDPRFSYARQVDYISGAALIVEADLWRAVGGFSEAFAPAYYEDVDLAFKVREAGRTVVYEPSATVVHFEGQSHGTDTASGVKRHQVLNAPLFKRTWAHRMPPQIPTPMALDRGVNARVLFVLVEVPRTDVDAGSFVAVEEIRLIQALGAKVTLLPRSMEYLPRYTEVVQAMGVEVVHAPFFPSMEAFLQARGGEFDAVYITRYQLAEALLPAIRRLAPQAKVLLNLADLQFLREMRAATAAGDTAAMEAAKAVRARELAAMRAADVALSYSDVETSVVFSHAGPDVHLVKAPWVQRVSETAAPFAEREGLAFLGNYRHPPNAEAVMWFAREVMPALHAKRPDIRFLGYGSYADVALKGVEGVEIGGYVPDLQVMFDSHRLFVAPLQSGAGLKGKVFQAMAAGIPTVLTPLAAEGIEARYDVDCLVAHDGEAFVKAILSVYDDEARWTVIADSATRLVKERYSVERGIADMRAAFEAADIFLPGGPSGTAAER